MKQERCISYGCQPSIMSSIGCSQPRRHGRVQLLKDLLGRSFCMKPVATTAPGGTIERVPCQEFERPGRRWLYRHFTIYFTRSSKFKEVVNRLINSWKFCPSWVKLVNYTLAKLCTMTRQGQAQSRSTLCRGGCRSGSKCCSIYLEFFCSQ